MSEATPNPYATGDVESYEEFEARLAALRDASEDAPEFDTDAEVHNLFPIEPSAVALAGEDFEDDFDESDEADTGPEVQTAPVPALHPEFQPLPVPLSEAGEPGKPIGGTWAASLYAMGDGRPGVMGHGALKLEDSAVSPLVASAHGLYTIADQAALTKAVAEDGMPNARSGQGKFMKEVATKGDLLIMPFPTPLDLTAAARTGSPVSASAMQFKPSHPRINEGNGKPRKYELVYGSETPLALHPSTPINWLDDAPTILIAEGLLKGLSTLTAYLLWLQGQGFLQGLDLGVGGPGARARLATAMNFVPVTYRVLIVMSVGVGNWKKNPEWRHMSLRDKAVLDGVDGDVTSNHQVWKQVSERRKYLRETQRVRSWHLIAPQIDDDTAPGDEPSKVGLDDYFAKHGDWAALVGEHMTTELPARPASDDDINELTTVGSTRVRFGRGRAIRETAKQMKNDDGPSLIYVERTDVANFSVNVIGSETFLPGYPRRGDRVRTSWDLRCDALLEDGTLVSRDVLVWDNDRLHEIEKIREQAGVAIMKSQWLVTPSPGTLNDMAVAIRATSTDDLPHHFAVGRTGNMVLPEQPDLAERDPADLISPDVPSHIWTWIGDAEGTGAIVPDVCQTPLVRAEIGDAGLGGRIPDWQPVSEDVKDLRDFLVSTLGAYRDPTSLYLSMTKSAQAVAGGKPTGSLHIDGRHGSGKSEEAEAISTFTFGGAPPSAVNKTAGFLPSAPDNRSNTATVIDDVKRMEGDEKDWPVLKKSVGLLLRRGYDGPAASRGRLNETTKGSGQYAVSRVNQAYPTIIIYGEERPSFDNSTMGKMISYQVAMDFIYEGQAAGTLRTQYMEGLFSRMGRSLIEWNLRTIPSRIGENRPQTLENLEDYWGQVITALAEVTHRDAEGNVITNRADEKNAVTSRQEHRTWSVLDEVTTDAEGNQVVDYSRRDEMAKWEYRSREVFAGHIVGAVVLRSWMNALMAAYERNVGMLPDCGMDHNTDVITMRARVEWFFKDMVVRMFEAQVKHVEMCQSNGASTPSEKILELVNRGMANYFIAFYNTESRIGKKAADSRSTMVGKRHGVNEVDIMMDELATAIGKSGNEIRPLLRGYAIDNSEGKPGRRVNINGVETNVWRFDLRTFGATLDTDTYGG